MTKRAPAPTADEIRNTGELLAKYWPGARKDLTVFLDNKAPWDGALRTVRGHLKDAIAEVKQGAKIPISARLALTEFAAQYGTETRSTAGPEPREIRQNVRWSRTEMAAIEAAAEKLGLNPTDFVRNAAMMAAQKEFEATNARVHQQE
jgi:hypothetical protein